MVTQYFDPFSLAASSCNKQTFCVVDERCDPKPTATTKGTTLPQSSSTSRIITTPVRTSDQKEISSPTTPRVTTEPKATPAEEKLFGARNSEPEIPVVSYQTGDAQGSCPLPCSRVSMTFTVSRKTANNIVVRRKKTKRQLTIIFETADILKEF